MSIYYKSFGLMIKCLQRRREAEIGCSAVDSVAPYSIINPFSASYVQSLTPSAHPRLSSALSSDAAVPHPLLPRTSFRQILRAACCQCLRKKSTSKNSSIQQLLCSLGLVFGFHLGLKHVVHLVSFSSAVFRPNLDAFLLHFEPDDVRLTCDQNV